MLSRALEREGYEVVAAADAEAGIELLEAEAFHLVLTDLKLPGRSGLDVLQAGRRLQPEAPVVVLTAFGTVATAVEAMKHGAADFLEKPVEVDDLYRLVGELVEPAEAAEEFSTPRGTTIVGGHPSLRRALRLLQRVAASDSTVLLTGESGTGKELFARALHELSPRSERPFVAVNCAAIPRELVENELFGHEKGAFTGAHKRQGGRFEQAEGGTLLLDEIAELDLSVQGKVLRVLEERTFERVGGSRTLRADVRLVAATNRDLAAMVEGGGFRSDLFYRLEVFPIELPALEERREDIPLLTRYLLARLAVRAGRPVPRLDEDAERLLVSRSWPGNVRQLANLLERGLLLLAEDRWSAGQVESLFADSPAVEGTAERLRRALLEADGDKRKAAESLGISYRTLQRRVRELDLEGFGRYRS
ncbi:MAG: sigma-54 dependent transcriptional regulator [Thermoanaerobaculia bacterium]